MVTPANILLPFSSYSQLKSMLKKLSFENKLLLIKPEVVLVFFNK